jgi:ABC-type uncharacterized transport system involved in gliding motility auxiliary subunit
VITDFPEPSPITGELQRTQQAILMPLAGQIAVAEQLPEGVEVVRLLQTTSQSWLATDESDINYREGNVRGPLTLAVAVTAGARADGEQTDNAEGRLIVFGSADFAGNMAIDYLANRQLFVNAANWLTQKPDGSEELLSVEQKPRIDRTLILTGAQANLLIYSSVLFLPLAVAVVGGLVWWNRR